MKVFYLYTPKDEDEFDGPIPDEIFKTRGTRYTMEEFAEAFNNQETGETTSWLRVIEESDLSLLDKDLDDIMCTALEGGISYWVASALPKDTDYKGKDYAHEVISAGGILVIKEDTGEEYELDREKLLKGIELYLDYAGYDTKDKINTGDIDADGADCIIQFALFGEITYS